MTTCSLSRNPTPLGWGDHIRWQHEQDVARPVGARMVEARRGAAAMRRRAWDLQARPFRHLFWGRLSVEVERFVPGPTWEYVPPRDRPEHVNRRFVMATGREPRYMDRSA